MSRPDPDIQIGNLIGRFSLFIRKAKHSTLLNRLAKEPHYYFLLTGEEAQEIIDTFDESTEISAKLSEQLLWQDPQ